MTRNPNCMQCNAPPSSPQAANYAGTKIKGTDKYFPGSVGVDFLCVSCMHKVYQTLENDSKPLEYLNKPSLEIANKMVEDNQKSKKPTPELQEEEALASFVEQDDESSNPPMGEKRVQWHHNSWGGALIASGLIVLAIFLTFSTGYRTEIGFGSVPYMNVILEEGEWVYDYTDTTYTSDFKEMVSHGSSPETIFGRPSIKMSSSGALRVYSKDHRYTGLLIPMRYGLVFGVSLFALGIAMRMSSRNR